MSSAPHPADTVRFRAEDLVDRVPDPGWYRAIVVGVWKKPVETTGSLAVKAKLELVDDGVEGLEVWEQFVIEGSNAEGEAVALRRLARLMRACGVNVTPDVDLPLRVLQDRELLVKIVPDTFQGQARARVRSYRPLRPKEGATVSEADESGSTPF